MRGHAHAGNSHLFPKTQLAAVLRARHGTSPAGHHVVATAVVNGHKIVGVCYAWSQSRNMFVISSCGATTPANELYYAKYEGEHGEVESRAHQRPQLIHFLVEKLPLIDSHNADRQHRLAPEMSWPTRDVFFRCATSVVGMCAVDQYRGNKAKYPEKFERKHIGPRRFVDFVCKDFLRLRDRPPTVKVTVARPNPALADAGDISDGDERLDVVDVEGESEDSTTTAIVITPLPANIDVEVTMTKHPGLDPLINPSNATIYKDCVRSDTAKRSKNNAGGQRVAPGYHAKKRYAKSCFMCRKYRKQITETLWGCKLCGTPICAVDRTQDKHGKTLFFHNTQRQRVKRPYTCLHEHLHSTEDKIRCPAMSADGTEKGGERPTSLKTFPQNLKALLVPLEH